MTAKDKKLLKLRDIINENLRTQLNNDRVDYISTGHTVSDVAAKQSHCIFARRGCGKTLLLHHSRRELPREVRAIYVNCEDFKHHSFPNVLIELLEAIFNELDRNLLGWFGKSKALKSTLNDLRSSLAELRSSPDEQTIDVKTNASNQQEDKNSAALKAGGKVEAIEVNASMSQEKLFKTSSDIEQKYTHNENKLQRLNHNLPGYKAKIRDFFKISGKIKSRLCSN